MATDVSLPLVASADMSSLAVSPLCKHLIGQIALLDVLSCQLTCEAGVDQLVQVPKPSEVEALIGSAFWNGEVCVHACVRNMQVGCMYMCVWWLVAHHYVHSTTCGSNVQSSMSP